MAEIQTLADALAYLTPHPSTKGPVILTPEKMRAALAVIESVLSPSFKISDDYDLVDEWLDWNRARMQPGPTMDDKVSIHCLRMLIREQIEMSLAEQAEKTSPSPAPLFQGAGR